MPQQWLRPLPNSPTAATPIWGKAEAVDLSGFAGSPFAAPLAKVWHLMLAQGTRGPRCHAGRRVIADTLVAQTSQDPLHDHGPHPMQNLLRTFARAAVRLDAARKILADAVGRLLVMAAVARHPGSARRAPRRFNRHSIQEIFGATILE
jgi:hypothetical protein